MVGCWRYAGYVEHGGFTAKEKGHRSFQRFMLGIVPSDRGRGTGTRPPTPQAPDRGFHHLGMPAQPPVVTGNQADHVSALATNAQQHFWSVCFFDDQPVIEPVLLFQEIQVFVGAHSALVNVDSLDVLKIFKTRL